MLRSLVRRSNVQNATRAFSTSKAAFKVFFRLNLVTYSTETLFDSTGVDVAHHEKRTALELPLNQ
jgi:hypothetical protein